MSWNGDDYQRRFDELAAAGADVHGEAHFVRAHAPATVLDAGCGTGRVAVELARHGIDVVGVDLDESMLATARRASDAVEWVAADLCQLDLGRSFDVVVMAGNVPLFTAPGTQPALVAATARHVDVGGVLIAGFSTNWVGREYSPDEHEANVRATGLEPVERFSTWDRDPWATDAGYVVSVARRPGA